METISFISEDGDFLVIPANMITAVFETEFDEEFYLTKIYLSCGKVFYVRSLLDDLGCQLRDIIEGAKNYEAFHVKDILEHNL